MATGNALADGLEGVIFDLDGVLIDSEPIHAEAKRRVFEGRGLEVPERVYDAFKGQTDEQVLRYVAENYGGGDTVSVEVLIEEKREAFWDLLGARQVPMEGAEGFVKAAARRYPVGLCTSASPHTCKRAFDPLGWRKHFAASVTAADVEHPKPDPQPYQLTADRLGVAPERCLIVEDSLSGVRSACAAGGRVAALTTSMERDELEAAGAHVVVESFAELAERLGWSDGGDASSDAA